MPGRVRYGPRMISLHKPDVVLTHESDLDGLVSGVLLQRLAEKVFGAKPPLEAHHYHTWRQRDIREGAGWVSDLGFESRLDRQNWLIVDHHATECTPAKATLVHDLNKSAGLLCYELCREHGLVSPALDRLVHLNNISDLFLEKDPDFDLAGDYANLVKVYGFWNLHALIDGEIERLVDHPLLEIMAAKRRIEDPLGLEWSRRNTQAISPAVGFVDTVIGNNNLIVHKLLEQQITPYPVLLTLFRRPNGLIIASLRSRNGEALKVAEKLQGGGHANAAGATLPKGVRSIPDALIYLRQTLNPKPPRADKDSLNGLDELFAAIEQNRR